MEYVILTKINKTPLQNKCFLSVSRDFLRQKENLWNILVKF